MFTRPIYAFCFKKDMERAYCTWVVIEGGTEGGVTAVAGAAAAEAAEAAAATEVTKGVTGEETLATKEVKREQQKRPA